MQNPEEASEFWMFPHGSLWLDQKNQGDWVDRASQRKRPTRYRNNRRKRVDFLRSLFVRKKMNRVPTHNSIRQIAPRISISKSSVHRLVRKKNLHCYKRLKTPQMNSSCRKRRAERTGRLLQRFSIHSLPRLVFQDEKDFSLQVPTNHQNNRVYFNGPKKDVQPERLYSEGNNF